MHLDDAFGQGKTNARALGSVVEPLEEAEDLLPVPLVDAGAVVAHRDRHVLRPALGPYLDARFRLIAYELGRVFEEVLKDLAQPESVAVHERQVRGNVEGDPAAFELPGHEGGGFLHEVRQRDHLVRIGDPTDAREGKQVVKQVLHFFRRTFDVPEVCADFLQVSGAVVLLQEPDKATDGKKRAFEVVRDGIRKLLEFGVFDREFLDEAFPLGFGLFPLRDVRHHAARADGFAVPEHDLARRAYVPGDALFVQDTELQGLFRACKGAPKTLIQRIEIIRMDEPGKMFAEHLVGGDVKEPFYGRTDIGEHAREVEGKNDVLNLLDQFPEPRLALAKGPLRRSLLRHIPKDDLRGGASFECDRGAHHLHVDGSTVEPDEALHEHGGR